MALQIVKIASWGGEKSFYEVSSFEATANESLVAEFAESYVEKDFCWVGECLGRLIRSEQQKEV